MRAWLVLALALAACGRIGFTPPPGSGSGGGDAGDDAPPVPPDMIRVVVLGDSDAGEGLPVAGVTVLFEASDGSISETATDDTGTASAVVAGPTTVHVVEPLDDPMRPWQLSTFVDVPGGTTVHVGNALDGETSRSLVLTLPANPSADKYAIAGTPRCDISGTDEATTFGVAYDPACEGNTVDLYALATASNAPIGWLPVPGISLDEGTTVSATGSWKPMVDRSVTYPGFPDGAQVETTFYADLDGGFALGDSAALISGTTTVTAPTIGITPQYVFTELMNDADLSERSVVESYPLPGDTFDPSHMAPTISADVSDTAPQVRWHLGSPSDGIAIVCAGVNIDRPDTTTLTWIACAPATADTAHYPALPASVATAGAPAGSTWALNVALAVGLPGRDYGYTISDLNGSLAEALVTVVPGAKVSIRFGLL